MVRKRISSPSQSHNFRSKNVIAAGLLVVSMEWVVGSVASSAGASYYFSRGLLCLQQVREGWAMYFFFVLISCILSSFSNASSVGRRLDILKYCGLGRSNPAVVGPSVLVAGARKVGCLILFLLNLVYPIFLF